MQIKGGSQSRVQVLSVGVAAAAVVLSFVLLFLVRGEAEVDSGRLLGETSSRPRAEMRTGHGYRSESGDTGKVVERSHRYSSERRELSPVEGTVEAAELEALKSPVNVGSLMDADQFPDPSVAAESREIGQWLDVDDPTIWMEQVPSAGRYIGPELDVELPLQPQESHLREEGSFQDIRTCVSVPGAHNCVAGDKLRL